VILVVAGAMHEYRLLGAPVTRGPPLDEATPPDLTCVPADRTPLRFAHRTARAPDEAVAESEAGLDGGGGGGKGEGGEEAEGGEGQGEEAESLPDSMFIVNEVGSIHLSYTGKEV
jgi:hypothetical protein